MSKIFTVIIIIILIAGGFYAFDQYQMTRQQNIVNGKTNNMINNTNQTPTTPTPTILSGDIQITPIEHATMVLNWGGKVIYTDPTGGGSAFTGQPAPDLILLTDIHTDHLDVDTLQAVSKTNTAIIAPKAVADMLPARILGTLFVMNNGQKTDQAGFNVESIPMYNMPSKANSPHIKGRGNGYVVEAGGKRVYISGDTSATPEMRSLKNIDIAFVCMNLPYTMGVEEAADGVLAFKPKQVYPYHYKGTTGLSDLNKFKELVNKGDSNIEVVLLNWYPK